MSITTQPPLSVAGELLNLPNRITLARTLVAMTVATIAFVTGDFGWLIAGYATYWLGDSLDGEVARRTGQETVTGAVFDIVCDRACCSLLAAAFMTAYPEVVGPLAIFLFQFGVLDTMLSLAFLLWPATVSPNYFYKVDQRIWVWNWSRIAKGLNTGSVVVSLVVGQLTGYMEIPYAVALAAVVVKVASLHRLVQILTGRRPAVPAVR
jgi:CDP-diacylglycerol--glycerol-3-phosphate 3-phosphatidyltransferase